MATGEVIVAVNIEGNMEGKTEATNNSKEKVARTCSIMSVCSWESFLQMWKKIFVASCLFAVALDPLFLYVPMMKDDIKCLLSDRNLKTAVFLLRSLTDLFYIFDIIFQIYTYRVSGTIAKMWVFFCFIDILAILPLPQVAIFIFFSKMRDLRSLSTKRMAIMNFFVLFQYVPRVLRIYFSCKEVKRTTKGVTGGEIAIWVKCFLNFFMYILASHVLGAIWYFFAIQRMTVCWYDACRKKKGCDTSTFGCHEHNTFRNIKFLNDLCPISPANTTLFDFGIYSTILQSGILASTNYFQKISNCFWWGLRNLSSLGSNLEPSVDGWENTFAAFISIIGLLLFLYLIGNLQTYMQLDTARIEAHRRKMNEIESWLSKNGFPKKFINEIKPQIMNKVRQEVEEYGDQKVDLDYILSVLPSNRQSRIISSMPMARLKQVRTLQNMDEHMLRRICQYLEPREFHNNSIIIEEGKPLEMMLFIVDGRVSIEKRDGSSSSNDNLQQQTLRAEEVCGEELLLWPFSFSFPDLVLLATESAKAIGHVEALVLTARDLRSVVHLDYFVGMMCRTFSAKELEEATKNYHQSRIIRKDEVATFYKGVLPKPEDKTVVAVKTYEIDFNDENVAKEAAVASQTDHLNVVRFLGGCVEPPRRALVFEYSPKGTLFEHIHESSLSPTALPSLELRIKIASETAGALAYLHSRTPPIIHLWLSTKHILLDNHYNAKLSAIGQLPLDTAKLSKEGYTDPHFRRDRLAEKSDVYSFGVVLAELLTSQKPVSPFREGEEAPLATRFLFLMEEGRLEKILDGKIIVNEATSETAKKVADLAKRCLSSEREERPSMEKVAVELEGLRKFKLRTQFLKQANPLQP